MSQFLDLSGTMALVQGLYKKIWPNGNIQMSYYENDSDIGAGKTANWTQDSCHIIYAYDNSTSPSYYQPIYIKRKTNGN